MAVAVKEGDSARKKSVFESFVDDFQEDGSFFRGVLKPGVTIEDLEEKLKQVGSNCEFSAPSFERNQLAEREKSIFMSLVDEFEEDDEFYRGVLKQDASLEKLELQLKILGVAFNTSKNHRIGVSSKKKVKDSGSIADQNDPSAQYGRFLYSFKAGTFKISMASPFTVRQSICKSCMFGPDRHKIRRKTEERTQAEVVEDSSGKRKRKYCGTKKKSCPAKLVIRKVTVFPDYAPKSRTKYALDQKTSLLKKHLAAGGDDSGPVKTVDLCFVAMSKMASHRNHSFDDPVAQRAQNVDPRVARHILDLVRKGCTDFDLIQQDIKNYVEKVLFKDIEPKPSHLSRAFYPTKHDINNHIYVSMKRLMRDGLAKPLERVPVRTVVVSKKAGCFVVRMEETLKDVSSDEQRVEREQQLMAVEAASSSGAMAVSASIDHQDLPTDVALETTVETYDESRNHSSHDHPLVMSHSGADVIVAATPAVQQQQHHHQRAEQQQFEIIAQQQQQQQHEQFLHSSASPVSAAAIALQQQSTTVTVAQQQQPIATMMNCTSSYNAHSYQNDIRFCREQMREMLNEIYHAIYYCEDLQKLQRTSALLKPIAVDLRPLPPYPSDFVVVNVNGHPQTVQAAPGSNPNLHQQRKIANKRNKSAVRKPRLPRSSSLRAKYIEFWKNKNRSSGSMGRSSIGGTGNSMQGISPVIAHKANGPHHSLYAATNSRMLCVPSNVGVSSTLIPSTSHCDQPVRPYL